MVCCLALFAIAPTVNPAWQLAFERDNHIWISNADGKHTQLLAKNASAPKWSPDGRRIAYFRSGNLFILDIKSRRERKVFNVGGVSSMSKLTLSWDPKRDMLLCGKSMRETIALLDLSSPARTSPHEILSGTAQGETSTPCWSPSGRWLAFTRNGDIWIANRDPHKISRNSKLQHVSEYYEDARRLAPLAVFNDGEIGVSARTPFWVDELEWTPDEKSLYFHFQRQSGSGVSQIGYLRLKPVKDDKWEHASGFSYSVHWLPFEYVFSPRITPDRRALTYVSLESAAGALFVSDLNGKNGRRVMDNVWNPDWRPK